MLLAKFDSGQRLKLVVAVCLTACAGTPCPPAAHAPGATGQDHESAGPATSAVDSGTFAGADPNLVGFSFANCLFWYFQEKGWDSEGIGSISGGYVETGAKPAEAYERLVEFLQGYHPIIHTKMPVDQNLVRCFHLHESAEWRQLVK